MVEVRKSAKQSAARQRARAKAAEFREKQDKLEQLAVDYFVAVDEIEEIEETIEREIAAVRARAAQRTAAADAKRSKVITSMLALGAPRSEVAERLDITTRDVTKAAAVTEQS